MVAVENILGNSGSKAFQAFFAQKFQERAGFKLSSLRVVRNRRLTAGSDAREITVRLGTPPGAFEVAFVSTRVGRLVGSLYAVAVPGGHISASDIARLERGVVRRMRAVPRSA